MKAVLVFLFVDLLIPLTSKADLSSVRFYTGSSVYQHVAKLNQLPVRSDMYCTRWSSSSDGHDKRLTPKDAFREFSRMVANRGILGIDSATKHHYFQDSAMNLRSYKNVRSSTLLQTANLDIADDGREIASFDAALMDQGKPTVFVSCYSY